MDTPDRSRAAAAPLSNFEDSPVFNFINSLSPIQPVKSVHSAQTFHSLTFASISSIFTSPHVNPQKESRFLIRNPISDFARPESSTENGEGENLHEGVPNAVKSSSCAVVTSGDCSMACLLNEEAVDLPDDSSSLSRNLLQPVQFDSGSPNHNTAPCYSRRPDLKLNIRGKFVQPVQFVQDGVDKRKSLFINENNLQEDSCHENNNEDTPGCDWEALISVETDDLLLLEPSTESEACGGSDGISNDQKAACFAPCQLKLPEEVDGTQKTHHDIFSRSCIQNVEEIHENRHREITDQYETDHTPQILSSNCHNPAARDDKNQILENGTGDCVPLGSKVDSQQQRGTRRRCLVFDVAAVSKKNLHKDSNLNPSISLPPKTNFSSDDTQLVSLKHGTSPSPRMLPGIGLHLNALATTSKERVVTQNTLPSGRRLISMPCSIGPFHPPSSGQKTMKTSLVVENSLGSTNTELHDLQMELYDDSQVPASKNSQDSSQSSPKKKKRKSENGGEGEGCKRCNCKKSKCLKLYCECFAAGVYCVEPCSCHGCFNKPIHEETVLATRKQIESRNPLAFAPKVIRVSEPVQETGEEAHKTPASARHKRGCNCKKSSCLKKYCECFQGGVGCSISCRCEGCKNAFGRKDGPGEFENEGGELVACENEGERPDDGQQKVDVQTTEQDSTENTLPATPLQICRSLVEQQCFSRGKPPRSSTFPFGRSPTLNLPQSFRKCQIPLPPHKADKHVKTVNEDDTPEILKSNASPSSGVKIASPNRKRVSPPHNGIGLSPTRKGSRKLILKSIPSFPSLSADVPNEYPINCSVSLFDSSAPG